MDLKSFAIQQKIQGKSDLLRYVVNQEAVPVTMLENIFGELLESKQDTAVESISENYIKYLQERVRVGIVPVGENVFEVSGDISDNELEIIELLTGDTKDVVVRKLLDQVLNELRGSRDITIGDIEYADSDVKIVSNVRVEATPIIESSEVVEPERQAEDKADLVASSMEVDNNLEAESDESEHVEDNSVEESVEELVGEPEEDLGDTELISDIDFDDFDFDASEDESEEVEPDLFDFTPEDVEFEAVNAPEDDEIVDDEEDLAKESENVEESDEDIRKQADQAVLDVYEGFKEDLRAHNLDKRLNLNI